jgi:hypothetical protein
MIRLGYEIGTGKPVDIPGDRHIGVTGQTQMSGKTTTLEALVHRSGRRAVAFVTKRAENSFREAHSIPPYFRDSADWQFVASILEAMLGEKMKFERSWIIDACRGAESLAQVHQEVKQRLHGVPNDAYAQYYRLSKKERKGKPKPKNEWARKPAGGINASVFTSLEAYLDIVIPQIESLPYSKKLELAAGLNVMDLSEYTTEMQSLVIRSVLEWVYERERNTIVIIPESWEFIPQNRRSPVLLAAEELIRKGAASGNYVWLDSQDIAGVHKDVLRSVGVWILGVQREGNEIKRTIGHAGAPATKLKPEQIMTLGRGQFYACFDSVAVKTYVQPFWVGDVHAQAIARGEEKLESAERIYQENRSKLKSDPDRCPQCGGPVTHSAHGPYCPDESCKWGWEIDREPKPKMQAPQQLQIQEETPNESDIEKPELGESGNASGEAGLAAGIDSPAVRMDREAVLSDESDGPGIPEHGPRGEESEESMWREKYEALKAQCETRGMVIREPAPGIVECTGPIMETSTHLPAVAAASPQPPFPKRDNGDRYGSLAPEDRMVSTYGYGGRPSEHVRLPEFAAMLAKFLLADPAAIAALDAARPTIKLQIKQPVLPMDGATIPGRLALLIHEGFFKSPRPGGDALREFKRRGWFTDKYSTGYLNPHFKSMAERGFLTIEDGGYQAVPGMKIETVKA